MHNDTKTEIEDILTKAFSPLFLEVIDDSYAHRKHAEAIIRPEAGHFKVMMKSARFDGVNPLQRHRLVYEQLAELMKSEIHALSLNLLSSDE
jgi:stress-induced morphogen